MTGPDALGRLATMALNYGEAWEEIHDFVALLIEENKALRIKAGNWDELQLAREVTSAEPEDCEWKQLARRGQAIPAIKACRAKHGYSLREAKDCVEGYMRGAAS